MKKSDLKVFDIIELRNGEIYMLHEMNGELFGVGKNLYYTLVNVFENLSNNTNYQYDIVKVYRPNSKSQYIGKYWNSAPLIWESKKINLTKEDYIQLSLFKGLNYWIAKDKHRNCMIFKDKPKKYNTSGDWDLSNSGYFLQIKDNFSFIPWSAQEAINIDKLLEECEVQY